MAGLLAVRIHDVDHPAAGATAEIGREWNIGLRVTHGAVVHDGDLEVGGLTFQIAPIERGSPYVSMEKVPGEVSRVAVVALVFTIALDV